MILVSKESLFKTGAYITVNLHVLEEDAIGIYTFINVTIRLTTHFDTMTVLSAVPAAV